VALTLVVDTLTGLRDQLVAAPEMDSNLYDALWREIYDMQTVLSTVSNGFPMVPASEVAELVSSAAAQDTEEVPAVQMAAKCAEVLEKAAGAKGIEAGAQVALVKCALAVWKASGETDVDGASVKVVLSAALPAILKACVDKKSKEKAEKERMETEKAAADAVAKADEEARVSKIESIAKAASPAPTPAPVAPKKPVDWGTDLNRKR